MEHRLVSVIRLTWRGQPRVSYEAAGNLIGQTRRRRGLHVKAVLDRRNYGKGEEVSDEQLAAVNIKPDYTFRPTPAK